MTFMLFIILELYIFADNSLLQFNRGCFDDYRVTYFPKRYSVTEVE
mgnify:CR=1 FL=1